MNILYLSYDGLTDPLGQSQIIPYIVGCSRRGYHFSVISFEKPGPFKLHGDSVASMLEAESVRWYPQVYHKKPALLSTLIDVFTMRKKANRVIETEAIEALHCRSYVSAYVAFSLNKKTGIQVVFDMRGFWLDERFEGGIWKSSNPVHRFLYRYFKAREREWLMVASAVICLTHKAKEKISNIDRLISQDKITVIPCCADERVFKAGLLSPDARANRRKKLNIPEGDVVLGYVGSLGTWYLIERMIRQFAQLYRKKIVHRFLILSNDGPGPCRELQKKYGLSDAAVIIASVWRDEVPEMLSLMDIGIFYIRPSFSKIASSPTKLGEFVLSGIPVITNRGIGDLDRFFENHKIGICHDIFKEDQFELSEGAINSLLSMAKGDIRHVGINHLSLKTGIDKYASVYTSLK